MTPKVVVVDDDEAILHLFRLVLEEMLCEVTTFNNADDGIRFLKEHSDIDLLIIDIMMDKKDGITALKEIMIFYPEISAIVVSAYANWNIVEREEAFLKKFQLLQKPMEMQVLKHAIQIELKKRQKL